MTDETASIKIYVACLAAYNNGILHGRWIDATQGEDHIWQGIKAMLAASPIPGAEEYSIHDHEGFEGASISEYVGIAEVAELAAFIDEQGEIAGKLVEYFGDLEEAKEAIEDHYAGTYKSLSDFAQELTEQSAVTCFRDGRARKSPAVLHRTRGSLGDVTKIRTGLSARILP